MIDSKQESHWLIQNHFFKWRLKEFLTHLFLHHVQVLLHLHKATRTRLWQRALLERGNTRTIASVIDKGHGLHPHCWTMPTNALFTLVCFWIKVFLLKNIELSYTIAWCLQQMTGLSCLFPTPPINHHKLLRVFFKILNIVYLCIEIRNIYNQWSCILWESLLLLVNITNY